MYVIRTPEYIKDENQWYFDEQADVDAWTAFNATAKPAKNGSYIATATGTDPYITASVDFKALNYQVLIVKMKYTESMSKEPVEFYFKTEKDPSWSSERKLVGLSRITNNIKVGDEFIAVFDLSSCTTWRGHITGLRIDPFNVQETFEITEIRFYCKKGMEMNGEKPTKPTEVVINDATDIPEGLEVRAEGGARLEIVTDPTDPTKKVFKVTANSANAVYSYLNVYMHFAAGERYRISYKIMPLTDYNGADYQNTIIGGNLIYGTTEEGAKDHAFDQSSNKSTSSEWIQCSFERAIPRNYSAGATDRFQVWGKFSPQSNVTVSYLVTDIVIEILD